MKTVVYQATEHNIEECARLLSSGEVVAFPTETVYGLGGNALMPSSIKKIYEAKGRPSDNPLIVHVANKSDITKLVTNITPVAQTIIDKLMPGAVTIVLKKSEQVPYEVTGGLNTVAIRIPQNEIACELIRKSGCPVCAPSANTSTKPSPTSAKHVLFDLNGKIPAILDGGECAVGVESTVIDCTQNQPRLLRAGGMTVEEIENVVGKIVTVTDSTVALSPGMKYKHYAPKAETFVAQAGVDTVAKLIDAYDKATSIGRNPVIVCLDSTAKKLGNREVFLVGKNYSEYAHNLFAILRKCDDEQKDIVFVEGAMQELLGRTINNRLYKACGGKFL